MSIAAGIEPERRAAGPGLFECCALLVAVLLQIASLAASLQEQDGQHAPIAAPRVMMAAPGGS